MSKRDVISLTTFGKRVAEEELEELTSYFVETEQWKRLFSGNVDVVYGAKGSGKSAAYSLLISRQKELLNRGIVVIPAENPRGAPAFKDLVEDPPTSETEFRGLWKFYFLCLVGRYLQDASVREDSGTMVIRLLEEAKLLPREGGLRGLIRSVLDYVRNVIKVESLEGGIRMNPATGMPEGLTGRIILREPGSAQREMGLVSVDALLRKADTALAEVRLQVWIVLDRLDVAFAESTELESNALRAVFRVYLDLLAFEHISAKIFLRSDIWKRITNEGFREASHITRNITISWDEPSLLNLVIRRALHNGPLRQFYDVDPADVLRDIEKQRRLFYRIFPEQVDVGEKKPTTFDWMLSRTSDGTKETAPRELIHLLSSARDQQLKSLELGGAEPPEETLFDRTSLKEALPGVSKVRFDQTLCAEFPDFKKSLERLDGEKTQQTPETLAKIWRVSSEQALKTAMKLTEIGFFELRGDKEKPIFWVPFLYRDALNMVQGTAE